MVRATDVMVNPPGLTSKSYPKGIARCLNQPYIVGCGLYKNLYLGCKINWYAYNAAPCKPCATFLVCSRGICTPYKLTELTGESYDAHDQ